MTIFDQAKDNMLSGKDTVEETREFYNIGHWLEENINDLEQTPEIFSLLWKENISPIAKELLDLSEQLSQLSESAVDGVFGKLKKAGNIAKLQSKKALLEMKLKTVKIEVGKKMFLERQSIDCTSDNLQSLQKLFDSVLNIQKNAEKRKMESIERKNMEIERKMKEKEEKEKEKEEKREKENIGVLFTIEGVNSLLKVYENKLTITPKGIMGFMSKGIKGTKTIPFLSITAIQFKEAGPVLSGYIQFTISGGKESTGGIFAAVEDENTFMFAGEENNELSIKVKEYIELSIHNLRVQKTTVPSANLSDEIQKLAMLKEQGILSDEEFKAAKKKLIK